MPLASRNFGLFANLYGIPVASPAVLLTEDQSRLLTTVDINNTLLVQDVGNESLTVDAEFWRLGLTLDYGLSKHWMMRLSVPFIHYTGGFLDRYIDEYHQLLNLNEDSRPLFPRDQLEVSYLVNGLPQFTLTESQKDLGDISLQLAWQQYRDSEDALSYWMGIKLPTGSAEDLGGSGHTDIAIWLASQHQHSFAWSYTQLGILYMSDSDILTDRHRHWAGFANLGMAFRPWDDIEIKTQIDVHSKLYRSNVNFLGTSIQISVGASFHIDPQHQIDFVISEDIHAGSAPDINFNFSWYYYLD